MRVSGHCLDTKAMFMVYFGKHNKSHKEEQVMLSKQHDGLHG